VLAADERLDGVPSGVVDEGESSATALRALERRLTLADTDDDDIK
jgi:hypothetical protein